MPATAPPPAWKILKTVSADITELDLPPAPPGLLHIQGVSQSQTYWGTVNRDECLKRWKADLPENVHNALQSIVDAGWWMKHRDVDAHDIGWPEQWVRLRNRDPQSKGQPSTLQQKPSMLEFYFGEGATEAKGTTIPSAKPKPTAADIAEFEAFARKAALSPELAYLTIMALMYRYTGDATILAKFDESRERVRGHFEAIDKICGPVKL